MLVKLLKESIDNKPDNYVMLYQMFYDSPKELVNSEDITTNITL